MSQMCVCFTEPPAFVKLLQAMSYYVGKMWKYTIKNL
jgi:hypothetical protein